MLFSACYDGGMKVLKIDKIKPEPRKIEKLARFLEKEKIIVLPTDTAYGLCGRADREKVIKKIFDIKRRSKKKPIAVFVRDITMAERFTKLDSRAKKLFRKLFPGPYTLIVPRKKVLPSILSLGRETLGIRIPKSKIIKEITKRVTFPITATSANISGKEAIFSAKKVIDDFKRQKSRPDLIVDAGELPQKKLSRVLDLSGRKIKVLRK